MCRRVARGVATTTCGHRILEDRDAKGLEKPWETEAGFSVSEGAAARWCPRPVLSSGLSPTICWVNIDEPETAFHWLQLLSTVMTQQLRVLVSHDTGRAAREQNPIWQPLGWSVVTFSQQGKPVTPRYLSVRKCISIWPSSTNLSTKIFFKFVFFLMWTIF